MEEHSWWLEKHPEIQRNMAKRMEQKRVRREWEMKMAKKMVLERFSFLSLKKLDQLPDLPKSVLVINSIVKEAVEKQKEEKKEKEKQKEIEQSLCYKKSFLYVIKSHFSTSG
ncbi:hypothetical protein V8G54_001879, partial [Vigna mungo]